jgi:WD40 repeat protein
LKCSKGDKKIVYSSAFSPSGTYLATACENGSVGIWELSKGRFRQNIEFEGHNDEVRAVKFLAEDLIVSGGGDNSLRIWKLKSSPRKENKDLDLLLEGVYHMSD